MLTRAAKRRRVTPCCSRCEHDAGDFFEQPFYECVDCDITLDRGLGVCRSCRLRCHAGHDVRYLGVVAAYCDCSCGGKIDPNSVVSEGEEGEQEVAQPDPRLSNSYGTKEYWDERYAGNFDDEGGDEWLVGYSEVERVLRPHLESLATRNSRNIGEGGRRPAEKEASPAAILHVGCGDSNFSSDMYDAGFENIVNVDNSAVCIAKMQKRDGLSRPNMRYLTADATDLCGFAADSFDAVLDKTLLDALCCSPTASSLVPAMLAEVARVLRPGGLYIVISFSLHDAASSDSQAAFTRTLFESFELVVPEVAMRTAGSSVVNSMGSGEGGTEEPGAGEPVDFSIFILTHKTLSASSSSGKPGGSDRQKKPRGRRQAPRADASS